MGCRQTQPLKKPPVHWVDRIPLAKASSGRPLDRWQFPGEAAICAPKRNSGAECFEHGHMTTLFWAMTLLLRVMETVGTFRRSLLGGEHFADCLLTRRQNWSRVVDVATTFHEATQGQAMGEHLCKAPYSWRTANSVRLDTKARP